MTSLIFEAARRGFGPLGRLLVIARLHYPQLESCWKLPLEAAAPLLSLSPTTSRLGQPNYVLGTSIILPVPAICLRQHLISLYAVCGRPDHFDRARSF